MPWCETYLLLLVIFVNVMDLDASATPPADWMRLLCSCRNLHPQTMFCNAHFAIRVVILGNPRNRQRRFKSSRQSLMHFPVEIKKVYKGSHIFPMMNRRGRSALSQRIRLYSPFMPACTVTGIEQRRRYVLMGYVVEGKPVVSRCTWKTHEDNLTYRQLKGLRRKYGENCHSCSINYCTDAKNCPEDQFKCNLYQLSRSSTCYHDETFCRRKENALFKLGFKCKWAHSRTRLKNCINARCQGDASRCPEEQPYG